MATGSFFVPFFLLLPMLAACNADGTWNMTVWCSRIPHPDTCWRYADKHISHSNLSLEQFEQAMLVLAMQQALDAMKVVLDHVSGLRTERMKAVWKGCGSHLDRVIQDLGTAIVANSDDDRRQVALSRALVSVAGCYNESSGENMTEKHLEAMWNHLYRLIENAVSIRINRQTVEQGKAPGMIPIGGIPKHKAVVAQDGSGDFLTIREALEEARLITEGRFLIHLKEGVYNEYVHITSDLEDITMIGDGIGKTIITGNRHAGEGGISTFSSATFAVEGSRFIAVGITFRNTAGRGAGQAVALRSHSEHAAFYQCGFEGHQDTLFLFPGRQFFRECEVHGSMDMICGDSTALFQNCSIYLRRHNGSEVVITAQKREEPDDSGFVIHNSRVILTPELKPPNGVEILLGRPWGKFSRAVFVKSYLEGISSRGWREMGGNTDGELVFYGEFGNSGPGASTGNRVKWQGVRVMDEDEASGFTVQRFLMGRTWLPDTGIPYDSGL